MEKLSTAQSHPVELTAEQLELVVRRLAPGTWLAATDSPRGTWAAATLPRAAPGLPISHRPKAPGDVLLGCLTHRVSARKLGRVSGPGSPGPRFFHSGAR